MPVSVTAISGAALAQRGILRIDDLQRATPAVRATPTAGRRSNSQYEIRGITTIESLITEDPAVGIYVNEVYRARATGTNQSFFDVANLQVLYGPQGTLFGRNSSAGAVLITTNAPVQKFEAEVTAGYGNYDRKELAGMLNVPLSDTLAIRLAGQRIKRDGYGRNITNNQQLANENSTAGRVSIAFNPSSAFENLAVISYYKANEGGTLNTLYGYRPCPPAGVTPRPAASCSATFGPDLAAAYAAQKGLGPFRVADDATTYDFKNGARISGPGQYERPRNFSISNTTTVHLNDALTVKNIFGYNYVGLKTATDLDSTPVKLIDTYLDSSARQISDELQLQGTAARLNWVIGALYFRERGEDVQNSTQLVTVNLMQDLVGINKSYAAFAQATYNLTDQLSLTAGGRYTIDKRRATYINPTTQIGAGPAACTFPTTVVPLGTPCRVSLSKTFRQPTYTLSLDYKPTRDTLFYAAHRLGYRAGGFNARVANSPTALQPFGVEKVRDLELGFKGTFHFDNGGYVRPTIAVYRSWYSGIQKQSTIILPPPGPATTTVILNASDARVNGFEATLALSPVRDLEFNSFAGYVDGHYKNFRNAGSVIPTIPFTTSKWTAGVGMNWTVVRDPSRLGTITAQANYSFRSPAYSDNTIPVIEPESRIPNQHNVNAAIDWNNVGGSPISVEAWVRNMFNQTHILGGISLAGSTGYTSIAVGDPRMYGVTVKVRFGD